MPAATADRAVIGGTWTIDPEFVFTDEERDALQDALSTTTVSPYRNYVAFNRQVTAQIRAGGVPKRFADFVATWPAATARPFLSCS